MTSKYVIVIIYCASEESNVCMFKMKNVRAIQMGTLPVLWIWEGGGYFSRSPTVARWGNSVHCSLIFWREGWSEGLVRSKGDNKKKPCRVADSGKYSLVQSLHA